MTKDDNALRSILGPPFDCSDTGSLVPIYGKDVIKAQMPDAVAELLGIPRGLILDRFRVKFNEFVDLSWPFYDRGPLRRMVERRDFVTSVPTGIRLKFERALLFLDIFREFNAWVMSEASQLPQALPAGRAPTTVPAKRKRGRPTNAEVRARRLTEADAAKSVSP